MSDQTPETSMDAAEPSMEDILASIRKIIADDDAPADVQSATRDLSSDDLTSDDLTADNLSGDVSENFGNISNLVELRPETEPMPDVLPDVMAEPVADIAATEQADPLLDLDIEHFVEGPVDEATPVEETIALKDDNIMSELEVFSDPESMDLTEAADDVEQASAQIPDPQITEQKISDPQGLAETDLTDFDIDTEFNLEDFDDLADLEIPTPDPSETIMSESVDLANSDQTNISPSGMAHTAIAGAGAVGAAAVTAFSAAKSAADNANELGSLDIDEALNLDDIDAALSDLDETTAPIDDETPIEDIMGEDLAFDNLLIEDVQSSEQDTQIDTQTASANLDDDTARHSTSELATTPVSDHELDMLLEEMNLVTEEPNDLLENDLLEGADELSDAPIADEGEDADLILVKSLMADLADYNSDEPATDDLEQMADASQDVADESVNMVDDLLEAEIDADLGAETDEDSGESFDATLMSDIPDDMDDDEAIILDEILNMTLDDELASQEGMSLDGADDVAALENDNLAANLELDAAFETQNDQSGLDVADDVLAQTEASEIDAMLTDIIEPQIDDLQQTQLETSLSESFSLSDIAAAAQADADEEAGFGAILAGLGAAAGTAGAVAATRLNQSDAELHAEAAGHGDDVHALTQFDEDSAISLAADEADTDDVDDISGPDDIERMLAKLLDDEVKADETEESAIEEDEPSEASHLSDSDADELELLDIEVSESEVLESDISQSGTLEPENLHQEATDASESRNLLQTSQETPQMPRAATKNTDVIMDDMTEAATASVFAELNQVVEEKAIVAERGDRVGDLVMEALRPMLKDWLDANLKGIVERAVTKEVKRISSGK